MTPMIVGPAEIALAAAMILASAGMSLALRMGLQRALPYSTLRMALQLVCVGYVLRLVILHGGPWLTLVILLLMTALAAREVGARQKQRTDYAANLLTLILSTGSVSLVALLVLDGEAALDDPQLVIPIFGIVLGTAMNSAALTLHALSTQVRLHRTMVEARLALGHEMSDALRPMLRSAITSGTIPTLNQMAGAGIITLPGIMSGQILAGHDPMQAALTQIFLMCLLAVAAVICVALSVHVFCRRIADERQRLRLDRLGS